jgi:hypothetical protein
MLVKSGIVLKKKGMVKNIKRRLILTKQPRLYFQTADTGEYKSDILITPFVHAIYHGGDKFEIHCKKSAKRYQLKVDSGSADEAEKWVSKINRVIEAFTK